MTRYLVCYPVIEIYRIYPPKQQGIEKENTPAPDHVSKDQNSQSSQLLRYRQKQNKGKEKTRWDLRAKHLGRRIINPRSIRMPRKRGDPALITNVLDDPTWHATGVHHLHALCFHSRAADIAFLIHDPLERIVFPAKDVVAVVAVPGMVVERVDERLATVFRPKRWVIEWCSLVDDFVHKLGHPHGMGGWAGALVFECP